MTAAARRGLSLRSRVYIGLGAIAAVSVVIAIVVTLITQSFLVGQVDERLEAFASVDIDGPASPRLSNGDETEQERPSDVWRGIVDSQGRYWPIYWPNTPDATESVPEVPLSVLPEEGAVYLTVASSESHEQFRVLARATTTANGTRVTDVTALSLDPVKAATTRLLLIETLGLVAIGIGLAVVGWWVVRLGVNPMRRMVDASKQIAGGDLDVRLEGAGQGSESAELATSLNTMIATLTTALEKEERSAARLREFVADASHELRTPLTTVLGYAELYRRGALPNDAAVADAWGRTEAEASRMRRLVQDMLELAKYDAEPQLARIPVPLATLCAEVVGDAQAARSGVTFTVDAVDEPTVLGDPDRLRQAVINVVTNAAVHGGSTVTVRVSAEEGAGVIAIIDDGPGMAPEVAARAAERFVRGDSSRARSSGGAGLGLAITAAIAEAHGGSLAVQSELGAGATVRIALPLAPTD